MASTSALRLRLLVIVGIIAAVAGAAVLVATRAQSPSVPAGQPASAGGAPATVATVDGQAITMEELESSLGTSLSKLEQDLYTMKRERLEAIIGEKLLAREAAKRGVEVPALVQAEVTAKITPVTEEDVNSFFETNKARLPAVPDIKDQIRRYLEGQRAQARQQVFLNELRTAAKVAVTLPEPPIRRAAVEIEGRPVRGSQDAPVTIVEFSDFHCPFCKRVQPTLSDLLARYPGKVRLVYKDLPLDSLHPQARRASEAARCAQDQGKFWEYHDKMYQGGSDVSPEYLKKLATDVGLDVAAFEQCLASAKHQPGIQRDVEEASRLGLSGTPAFFVNGRALSGAQPLEAFVQIIEDELKTPGAK